MRGDTDGEHLEASGGACVAGSTVAALVANLAEESAETRTRVDALVADIAVIRRLLESHVAEPAPESGITADELRETLVAALNSTGRRIVRAVDQGLEEATTHGVESVRAEVLPLHEQLTAQLDRVVTEVHRRSEETASELSRQVEKTVRSLDPAIVDLTQRLDRRLTQPEGESTVSVLADANRMQTKTAEALRRVADQLERLAEGRSQTRVVERQLGDLQHQVAEQATTARSRHDRLLAEVAEVRSATLDGTRPGLGTVERALRGVEAALETLTATVERAARPAREGSAQLGGQGRGEGLDGLRGEDRVAGPDGQAPAQGGDL